MFARIATRTGVQLPSPPAFALRDEKRTLSRRSLSVGGLRIVIFFSVPQRLRLGRPAFFAQNRRPVSNTMKDFYYVYILVSEANDKADYIGATQDLRARLMEHNRGKCPHTSKHSPWRIETAVAFRSEAKARRFERYLKTGSGREFGRRHF